MNATVLWFGGFSLLVCVAGLAILAFSYRERWRRKSPQLEIAAPQRSVVPHSRRENVICVSMFLLGMVTWFPFGVVIGLGIFLFVKQDENGRSLPAHFYAGGAWLVFFAYMLMTLVAGLLGYNLGTS